MNTLCLLGLVLGAFIIVSLVIYYFVKEKYSNQRKLRDMRNERKHRTRFSQILRERGLENAFPNDNNRYGPIGGRPGGITAI
jgi:uncharacterized membrane protein